MIRCLPDAILYCHDRATLAAKMGLETRPDGFYWQQQKAGWLALAASYESLTGRTAMPEEDIPQSLPERLAWLLRHRDMSARAVSRAADLGDVYVSNIISGQSKNPQIHNLERIVAVLDSSVDFLMGRTDDPNNVSLRATSSRVPAFSIPIVGIADAGTYRSAAVATSNVGETSISGTKSARYANARHFAVIIRDEQMTALAPYPLMPGTTAILVDFGDIGGEIETGRIYYITRMQETQTGVVVEKGLWLSKVTDDTIEFRAASANPQINAEHRFTVSRSSSFQDAKVFVEGLLYAYQGSYEDQLASGPE